MLKTVRSACILQDNALDIRVSDQIEQLDQLIAEEGDGDAFFAKTHITHGMRELVTEGLARLAGKSSQAIFHLKQAMGGGKTHLLVGLGLLAKHPSLRLRYCGDVPYINMFPTTQVAAFNGRNNPPHFLWGEIAQQLNKPEVFRSFWEAGPHAPDEKDWLALFAGGEPILILLDEMPPYFHYLATQRIGDGTVADIATRAFANLLTAAGKKANVCVVVSDLATSYDTGRRLINRALDDAKDELGRQERTITPVDLSGNEVYDILRKRLFKQLPDPGVIDEVATAFGRILEDATKAKTINRGAEAIADEIVNTYPFHPRLKNLVALFKENEKFKQTRGLMELASRLLKSTWERSDDEVYLIGAQHFDLALTEVREKLAEISEMRDVIAKDLWETNQSAHAQVIDLHKSSDAARQVGALLLTASLSTAVSSVKGLTREETLECLVTPLRGTAEFAAAFDALASMAWYLHKTPEGRVYFDRTENLTKLLQSLAKEAPDNQVDELIRFRLIELFKPTRKSAYSEVMPLPRLDEVVERIRRNRVLLIVSPEARLPPAEVSKFFDSLSQKNNLCVLTGDKTEMASLEQAARKVFAARKADSRIPKGHPQRDDLEKKQQEYEQDFTATMLSLFDKLLFPRQRPGKPPQLVSKPLDLTRDAGKPFNGEEQIEKTLLSDPLKLYLDVEGNFDALRDKAENLLWPAAQDETRWKDVEDRAEEQAGMPWLPPNGLEQLKTLACNRVLWEDLGGGYVTKKPTRKKTSVQVTLESPPDDAGQVRLRVQALNGGPAPRLYYAEDGPVTVNSRLLDAALLTTQALRVQFLAVDPSAQFETGDPVTWAHPLVIRNELRESDSRMLTLRVAPRGEVRYTLDGSEARYGTLYQEPFLLGSGEVRVQVFAEADGLEAKADFHFPAKGVEEVAVDYGQPVRVTTPRGKRLDSRAQTFTGLSEAKSRQITFERVTLVIGQGSQSATVMLNDFPATADYLESVLKALLEKGPFAPDTPVTMSFAKAHFASGHDLKRFAEALGIVWQPGEIEQ